MTTPIEQIVQWANAAGISGAGQNRLSVTIAGGQPIPVELTAVDGGIELAAEWAAPAEMAGIDLGPLARATALSRSGLLRCEAGGAAIRILAPVFTDGLTQQAALSAAAEVGKAYEVCVMAAQEWAEQKAAAEEANRTLAELDAALTPPASEPRPTQEPGPAVPRPTQEPAPAVPLGKPSPSSLSSPSSSTSLSKPASSPERHAQPEPAQSAPTQALPVQAPPTHTGPAAWRRTHVTAPGGITAWAAPDPAAPNTQLRGGFELMVVERRDDWAHVTTPDGWHGWVDSRQLRLTS